MKLFYNFFLFFFFILFCTSQCSQKKDIHLNSNNLLKIRLGDHVRGLVLPKSNSLVYGIPERFGILGNRIAISEMQNYTVKIFHRKKLETILHSSYKKTPYDTNFGDQYNNSIFEKKINIKKNTVLQVPGKIVAGKKNNFFIVNYLESLEPYQKKEDIIETDNTKKLLNTNLSYYNIIEIDTKGNMLRFIERKRNEGSLFQNIIWLETDNKGKLWVLYLHNNQLVLDSYINGKLFFYIEEEKCLSILFPIQEKKFIYECLRMYPFHNTREILLIGKISKKPTAKNKINVWDKDAFQQYTIKTLNWDFNIEKTIISNLKNMHSIPFLPFGKDKILVLNHKKDFSYKMFDIDGLYLQKININTKLNLLNLHSLSPTIYGKVFGVVVEDDFIYFKEWK